MEIQSAFNAGVQGFQKATEDANQAAATIASSGINTNELQTDETDNQQTRSESSSTNSLGDLTQAVVDLRVAEFQAKASANVIESADENLGTLLDVRV